MRRAAYFTVVGCVACTALVHALHVCLTSASLSLVPPSSSSSPTSPCLIWHGTLTFCSTWVYKNKDQGQLAAGASLGMLHLWNDNQLSSLDKLLYAPEDSVKAGALLGIGLCCTGTRNLDADPAFALLSEHLDQGSTTSSTAMRSAAALGLGLAYAGSRREEVASLFVPFVQDTSASASMELASTAALALGLVFVGSGNEEYAAIIADRCV